MSKITTIIRILKLSKYLDVKYLKRALILTLCYNILKVVCIVAVLVPLHNSYIANELEVDLLETPLPENTEFIESLTATGKLVGSDSDMNFFGGMLIKSELTEDELNEYYSPMREDHNDYLIESQDTAEISVIENGDYSFEHLENVADFDNYYLVYSWGSDESVLQSFNKFDFRTLKFNA
ncbi:MAG: hypothetical protein II931_00810 [Clostridia bacterium]|nr:hypothetical protein [Clostridia bacterium]